ncbi:unnamed protein product [Meloidogyne enterolobii]|uniref:Uncharacterized protein n=1 Tax=Meloidogyne enterolobii TaxID=390850 RepID=A0ACB0YSK8_MELEN
MFLSLVTILQLFFISAKLDKMTKNIKITSEDEKLRDQEGYLAIKAIHGVLDNDQSGSIERYESADFLTEDLKFGESEREKREKAFHGNDESITVDDLWDAWFQSDVREWDEKQVIDWLVNGVKLPQYVNNFMREGITGIDFPRLAAQNSSIFNSLDIKNSVHRQKLQLKALDLVLFGSQDSSSLIKDIALASLLICLISLLIIFKAYKNRAKKQMEELSTRLSKLRDMETDFEGVHQQQKFEEENKVQQQQPTEDSNGEVNAAKGYNYNPVLDFENEQKLLGVGGGDLSIGGMDGGEHFFFLQTLLRRTYEIESAYLGIYSNCFYVMSFPHIFSSYFTWPTESFKDFGFNKLFWYPLFSLLPFSSVFFRVEQDRLPPGLIFPCGGPKRCYDRRCPRFD